MSDELLLIYKLGKNSRIRLFGEEFARKNKNK